MTEQSFTISIPESKLDHLHAKLDLVTWPDELEGVGTKYGAPLADIQRLVARWRNGYDWRKHEAALNAEMPQFTRDVEVKDHGTLNIHYVHQKSSDVANAIPLLFVHGWPGSFLEVRKVLPLLTASSPDHPSFHVVAMSLPGYGFSEAPKKPGFAHDQMAEVGNKLMLSLGYDEYITQGGDWGAIVTHKMATLYGGKSDKAWHTNMPIGRPPRPTSEPIEFLRLLVTPWTAAEKIGIDRSEWFQKNERGYFTEQASKPQTLGYGLADSPVGLLAWIYEKLITWTDSYPWDDDEVLTWIALYWFSRAGPAASIRIYYETDKAGDVAKMLSGPPPTIPLGFSRFPKELTQLPKKWSTRLGNVVFDSTHERGGHFAAHEQPNELVDDLRKMFGKGGPAFGVVTGKSGYAGNVTSRL